MRLHGDLLHKTYQQDIGQDAAEHATLHDANLALPQCDNADDQFNRISERGIHQPTNRLAQLRRQLLRREGQQPGQWDDGQEVQDEDGDWIPPSGAGDDAERDKDEEDVGIVGDQD